jgi:hypothetical protein
LEYFRHCGFGQSFINFCAVSNSSMMIRLPILAGDDFQPLQRMRIPSGTREDTRVASEAAQADAFIKSLRFDND